MADGFDKRRLYIIDLVKQTKRRKGKNPKTRGRLTRLIITTPGAQVSILPSLRSLLEAIAPVDKHDVTAILKGDLIVAQRCGNTNYIIGAVLVLSYLLLYIPTYMSTHHLIR